MKIKLMNNGDYTGLREASLPFEVEPTNQNSNSGLFYVPFSEMIKIPGFYWHEDDAVYGESYAFFNHEVEVLP